MVVVTSFLSFSQAVFESSWLAAEPVSHEARCDNNGTSEIGHQDDQGRGGRGSLVVTVICLHDDATFLLVFAQIDKTSLS